VATRNGYESGFLKPGEKAFPGILQVLQRFAGKSEKLKIAGNLRVK